MRHKQIWLAGAALGILGLVSCVSDEPVANEAETKPFIDPLILAQSRCGGPDKQPLGSTNASDEVSPPPVLKFGQPFALPPKVVQHFHYPVSTENDAAQVWFDTGLAHMANFNHDEAIAAFRKAQEIDPKCAICYWGEGFAFGSNINAPYEGHRGAAGRAATDQALTLLEGASDKEIALIKALDARYSVLENGDTIETADAFADAMDLVARAYPADKFILSLAAEANMDTQPWDYWQPGARVPKGRTARTLELLETALKYDPDFAPSIHLYIHVTESSLDPFRAESYADRLQDQALGVGHLVHMPSHIYLRLGRWKKSHEANISAIAADEAYIANSENAAFYSQVYYPHNIHFVVSSSQFAGDADTAIEMANKLGELVEIDPSAPNPLAEHIAASEIFTALQFSGDEAVLSVEEPAAKHLYIRTAWHYARGVVFARQDNVAAAEEELAKLNALTNDPDFASYEETYFAPLPGVQSVAQLTLEGRIHAAKGDLTSAIDRLAAAAEVEAQLPYFEPTWWYYPTRQTLGMYLLMDRQFDRAEREFFKTLIKAPNNAYALYGLAETYRVKGDTRSEAYARELFNEAWMGRAGATPKLTDL